MIRKIKELSLLTSETSFNAPVYYKAVTTSTMDDASELIAAGAVHGTVIRAGYQTAGRGRIKDRRWNGRADENLFFTIILERKIFNGINLPLSLLLGWTVARFLSEDLLLPSSVKWPNDVLVDDRKICGILCESSGNFYTAGIGLNINQTEFPPDTRRPAVSLKMLLEKDFDPHAIMLTVMDRIALALEFPPDNREFESRLYGLGEKADVLLGDPSAGKRMTGVIKGVQKDGALVLEIPGENHLLPVYSGEIVYSGRSKKNKKKLDDFA